MTLNGHTTFWVGEALEADIPLEIVLDLKALTDVLHKPGNIRRSFSWPVLFGAQDVIPDHLGAPEVLHVVAGADAGRLLADYPDAFCLVIQAQADLPDWLPHYTGRCCIVHSRMDIILLFARLQGLFAQLLFWQGTLERELLKQASLKQLLFVSAKVLPGFVYAYDSALNLLAHLGSPPDANHARLIENGILPETLHLSPNQSDLTTFLGGRAQIWVQHPREGQALARLYCPIKANGVLLFDLVLVLEDARLTPGVCALFSLFAYYAQNSHFDYGPQMGSSHQVLLTKLLNDEHLKTSYIEAQATHLGIPIEAEFRLLSIGPLQPNEKYDLASIIASASELNGGDCLTLPWQGSLLVLCYCEKNDSLLSTRRMEDSVRRSIQEPFGLSASSSQIFSHLKDLNLAYQQTTVTRDFQDTIDAEQPNKGGCRACALYAFEDAFLFYLICQREPDTRFLAFSFSHTILEKLHREDVLNGTDDLGLLWHYIYFERKVSAVAERMHMHRNTVLYRIERIQKRFDLDFSEQGIRDRLLLDYKVHFLVVTGKHQLSRKIRKGSM